MENALLVIFTALFSGIVATIVTIWWQRKNQDREEKTRIFITLMSKRYDITAEENVDALNMIDVIFYKSHKVRSAWKDFYQTSAMPDSPTKEQAIGDKFLKLLELIADEIGYKNIHWDDIKQYYYPIGLLQKRQDELTLRKIQIDNGLAQIKKDEEHKGASQTNETTQLLMKALENPENL